eukprot:sb/3479290/
MSYLLSNLTVHTLVAALGATTFGSSIRHHDSTLLKSGSAARAFHPFRGESRIGYSDPNKVIQLYLGRYTCFIAIIIPGSSENWSTYFGGNLSSQ